MDNDPILYIYINSVQRNRYTVEIFHHLLFVISHQKLLSSSLHILYNSLTSLNSRLQSPSSSMDVIFEPQKGRPFSIEVGFFDTVLEIKEKIQKYQEIPIPKQTLIFNNQVLQDDRDVESCEILQNSRIRLLIASPESETKPHLLINKTIEPSLPPKKLHLKINLPSSKTHILLEMEVNENVVRLKEKIHEMFDSVPVTRLVLQANGVELSDNNKSLRECDLIDGSEIDVSFVKPSPASSGTGSAGQVIKTGSRKLRVMILPKCGNKKIPVDVNAADNVGELRKELQKLHQRYHFHLPPEGYFFIYKQNVMDDDRSFRWHRVSQGDTIEIFNGSVTGGS